MAREAEEAGERATDTLKQRVFASAFGAFDPQAALGQYYKVFEEPSEAKPDFDIEEFEPENESDILEMLNAARRAGAIS